MTPARTVTLPAFQISGVADFLYTPVALSWSPKRVAEVAVFSADFGPQIDPGDLIVAAAVTVTPDVIGGLQIVKRMTSGTMVYAMFSGGVAGQTYAVTLSAATVYQNLHPATVSLQVLA